MSKKKGAWKCTNSDFTLNDSANAPKPVRRLKKAAVSETTTADLNWDEMDDFNLIAEVDANGHARLVFKKKNVKVNYEIENRPGIEYPEIIFYLISAYIKPEDIGRFAGINKAAYACTQRESFWRNLYMRYCQNHPRLPPKLRIENSFQVYGLRQRVIRALYHTYSVFIHQVERDAVQDCMPHRLIKRRCVNVWYNKGPIHWLVYLKFKKVPLQRPQDYDGNLLEELGKIDANPEEDCQVLRVTCAELHEVPALLGMTLTSLAVVLSPGYRYHRITLGFNTGAHNMSRHIVPERFVVIDTVVNLFVCDWWNPMYPHFDNYVPPRMRDEESEPVLKQDFFKMSLDE